MKKTIFLIISYLFIQSISAATFKELQVIPLDSTNAELMKIWFPVKAKDCFVQLKILDTNKKLVRMLLQEKVKNGYYNVYWDKKDSSGNFVAEGRYNLATISCDYKRLTPIRVTYKKGENSALFTASNDEDNPSLNMQLSDDSVQVSLEIVNIRDRLIEALFTDSLITGTRVDFIWNPSEVTPTGKYFYKVKVNDFEQKIPFRYKK